MGVVGKATLYQLAEATEAGYALGRARLRVTREHVTRFTGERLRRFMDAYARGREAAATLQQTELL